MLHFWVSETYIGPVRAGGGSCRISKTCILTIFKMYLTFLRSPPLRQWGWRAYGRACERTGERANVRANVRANGRMHGRTHARAYGRTGKKMWGAQAKEVGHTLLKYRKMHVHAGMHAFWRKVKGIICCYTHKRTYASTYARTQARTHIRTHVRSHVRTHVRPARTLVQGFGRTVGPILNMYSGFRSYRNKVAFKAS